MAMKDLNLQTYVLQCTECGILKTLTIPDTNKPHLKKVGEILEVGRVHKQQNPDHTVQFIVTYKITEPPGANQ